eukprot:SAG31_NODE_4628_length_3085_cov_372.429002_6_plen_198_part_00
MVLFAGLGLGGVAIVGGFAVWQRLWLLLLKVSNQLCSRISLFSQVLQISLCVDKIESTLFTCDEQVAIAAMAGFVWLYVLLVLAYVISHDIRSPMREFADGNWREGAAIATTELAPDYCIAKVPENCVSPLKATSGSVIVSGDACDVKCKEAWVKDADESMKPLGFCLYLLCIVLVSCRSSLCYCFFCFFLDGQCPE